MVDYLTSYGTSEDPEEVNRYNAWKRRQDKRKVSKGEMTIEEYCNKWDRHDDWEKVMSNQMSENEFNKKWRNNLRR